MYQVLETAHQVARLSMSTRSDVPFGEMAHQCQELSNEKQEKMFHLMNIQRKQVPITTSKSCYEEDKPVASYFQSDPGYQTVSVFLFSIYSLLLAFQSIYHMHVIYNLQSSDE